MNIWPFRWNPFVSKKQSSSTVMYADVEISTEDAIEQILFSMLEKYKKDKCQVKLAFEVKYYVEKTTNEQRMLPDSFETSLESSMKYDTEKKYDEAVSCEYFDLTFHVAKTTNKITQRTCYDIHDARITLKKPSSLSSEIRKSYVNVACLDVRPDIVKKYMNGVVAEYYRKEDKQKTQHVSDVLSELKKI